MGTKHHRLPREHYRGRVSAEFTLCLERRSVFFTTSSLVGVFVDLLGKIAEKRLFFAIYCFMPDHVHMIFLGGRDDAEVLRGAEDFKQVTGYWLASHYPEVKWQKSFHDRIIRTRELAASVRYVLDNPVRKGLVRSWMEYSFTGAIGLDLEILLEELARF